MAAPVEASQAFRGLSPVYDAETETGCCSRCHAPWVEGTIRHETQYAMAEIEDVASLDDHAVRRLRRIREIIRDLKERWHPELLADGGTECE